MALTKNPNGLKWLDEMVGVLTTPDEVVWIDGTEEQLEGPARTKRSPVRRDGVNSTRKNSPGRCLLHRTAASDVARVEDQHLHLLPERGGRRSHQQLGRSAGSNVRNAV